MRHLQGCPAVGLENPCGALVVHAVNPAAFLIDVLVGLLGSTKWVWRRVGEHLFVRA